MAKYSIAHVEIPATNAEASGKFYSDVFGWQMHVNKEHNYVIFEHDGLRGGFTDPKEPTYKPNRLLVYLACDDIEGTLATIEAHGGKTLVPKTVIPHVGAWAIFADPAGNEIGLYKREQQ